MKKVLISISLVIAAQASQTIAAPCVSTTFDIPVPGAINVVTRHADVPSPQFPGLWQEGRLDGLFYALYANGEGYLKPDKKSDDWEIWFTCEHAKEDCTVVKTGEPTVEALETVSLLTSCLLGRTNVELDISDQVPETVVPLAEAAPCGVDTIAEGPEGVTLQRLLVEVGKDPGPVDGFVGENTRKALAEILGSPAFEMPLSQAISELSDFMCIKAHMPKD